MNAVAHARVVGNAHARAVGKDLMFRRMLDRTLIGGPKVENLSTVQASTAIRRWAQRVELFFASGGDLNSVPWECMSDSKQLFCFYAATLIVRRTH